jgi:polysaccharide export outer membrane protein
MQIRRHGLVLITLFWFSASFVLEAHQDQNQMTRVQAGPDDVGSNVKPLPDYVLGSDDEIAIRALDADEVSNKPMRIDGTGNINIPMLGRVRAAGLTVRDLEAVINSKLEEYVREPQVSILILAYRSQPVVVIGSFNKPGTLQLEGHKTLIEVLAMAGGLNPEAGGVLKITRRAQWGKIPLPDSTLDQSCECSIANIKLRSLLESSKPEENIIIMPHDILSVPQGQKVYVIGEVHKPGAFIIADNEGTSVLRLVAMAEGLGSAASREAQILRPVIGSNRVSIPVNIKEIMAGKKTDVPVHADDILFVPNSYAKTTWRRTLDSVVQAATGIVIYRGW